MKRKILILTPQLPYPPEQGTSLRNFHIIKGLARHNEITLLTFLEAGQSLEPQDAGPLLTLCEHIVTVPAPARTMRMRLRHLLTTREPDMADRLQSAEFTRKLGRLMRSFEFDVVHVEGIELASAIPVIRLLRPTARILFDDHNAETQLQRRALKTDMGEWRRWPAAFYSLIQIGRLRRYERWACQEADWVTAVSEEDAAFLEGLSNRPVTVIPNCIDVSAYQPIPHQHTFDYDVVITGKMDYRPNVDAVLWFGQNIWPLIKRSRPDATWAIVGQKPHERLLPLRSLPGVTVTGRVVQVAPYFNGGRVYIMPFRIGSGTRLKLIEAMAAGKAIVSTSLGAEGFPVKDDEQIRLVDDPTQFARVVVDLLRDHHARKRLGDAAETFAQAYDWRVVIPRFEALYAGET